MMTRAPRRSYQIRKPIGDECRILGVWTGEVKFYLIKLSVQQPFGDCRRPYAGVWGMWQLNTRYMYLWAQGRIQDM